MLAKLQSRLLKLAHRQPCVTFNPFLLYTTVSGPNSVLILNGHLYARGVWWSVDFRMGTKETCFKEIGLCAQNSVTILGSTTITSGGTYMSISWEWGSSLQLWKSRTYELLYYEENGYKNDLDLLIVVHYLCVSYPTSSGCKDKSVCSRKVIHQICALLRTYLWSREWIDN